MADLLVSVANSFRFAVVNVLLLMESTSFLCSSCLLPQLRPVCITATVVARNLVHALACLNNCVFGVH